MRFNYSLLLIVFFLGCATSKKSQQKTELTSHFNNRYDTDWYAENHTFENNLAHFSDNNTYIKSESLVLELNNNQHQGKNYTAAELRSKKMFLYGRFEVRLKASDALGCITAFFLYRPNAAHNTEIDFEISGKYPKVITLNHWVDKRSHDNDVPLNFDSTKDFHSYVIHWKPNLIEWEVDGQIIHRTTTAVPNKAMQVVFNLWATKSIKWAGSIKDAKLPTFAKIDWFKYTPYKNK